VTGLQILLRAEAAGVRIRVDEDGTLRIEASSAPPAELVSLLREHREALSACLRHDAEEAEAMAAFYAAPAGPVLPSHDPVAEGLQRGFWAHRRGSSA